MIPSLFIICWRLFSKRHLTRNQPPDAAFFAADSYGSESSSLSPCRFLCVSTERFEEELTSDKTCHLCNTGLDASQQWYAGYDHVFCSYDCRETHSDGISDDEGDVDKTMHIQTQIGRHKQHESSVITGTPGFRSDDGVPSPIGVLVCGDVLGTRNLDNELHRLMCCD